MRISDLSPLTAAAAETDQDVLPVVDASEIGNARNKKMTLEELAKAVTPQLRITADGAVTVEAA